MSSDEIKQRRHELHYTLDTLSELTGISRTTLHRIENGKREASDANRARIEAVLQSTNQSTQWTKL